MAGSLWYQKTRFSLAIAKQTKEFCMTYQTEEHWLFPQVAGKPREALKCLDEDSRFLTQAAYSLD